MAFIELLGTASAFILVVYEICLVVYADIILVVFAAIILVVFAPFGLVVCGKVSEGC